MKEWGRWPAVSSFVQDNQKTGRGREGEVGFSQKGEGEEMKSKEQKARC